MSLTIFKRGTVSEGRDVRVRNVIFVVFAFLLIFSIAMRFPPALCVTEPKVTIYGTLTKDVTDLSNIWTWVDEDGNKTLPYSRTANITVSVGNIHFEEPFLNASTQGTFDCPAGIELTAQYLTDASGIPYILLYAKNTSAIASYYAKLRDKVDLTIDPDSYVVFAGKIFLNDTADPRFSIELKLIDAGGEDHYLTIWFNAYSGTDSIDAFDTGSDSDSVADDARVKLYNTDVLNDYVVVQFKISDILTAAGLSTEIVKVEEIIYQIAYVAPAAGDNELKVFFRYAFISSKAVKINNVILNGTTISLDADSITINRNVKKIADVVIPFEYELPPRSKSYNPDALEVTYEWLVDDEVLPNDPALSFSDVNLNYTVPSGEIVSLYINGADYLSSIPSDAEAGDKVTLLSLRVGTQYLIISKVKYSGEEFDAIVGTETPPPLTWATFADWLSYYFWHIVFVLASALGIAGLASHAKRQKRAIKARVRR